MKTNMICRLLVVTTIFSSSVLLNGCSKDFFDKNPLDAISDATFWKTESDAMLALTGCYNTGGFWKGEDFWTPRSMVFLDMMAGNGSEKESIPDRMTDGTLNSAYWVVESYWKNSYQKIAACNNFLDHIDLVSMDNDLKASLVAEVRTLRAYEYFNLGLYYGGVPLVKNILSIDQANSVERASRDEVWDFAETELDESYGLLPNTRPTSESGRITAGAALAIQGRLLMAREKWSSAQEVYKKVIDAKVYEITPNYQSVFNLGNGGGKEVVLSSQYKEDVFGHVLLQYLYPETWGGWHQFSPYNELVKSFECSDGKTIEESPTYEVHNPYVNRDPRLDYTILISDRSTFKGQTYVSRPGTSSPDRFNRYNWSGYSIRKFMDESFDGNLMNYGANFPLIRYAEVLLGYLESALEAGSTLDQTLLDNTINLVRGRADVQMPAVTLTDRNVLRNIIRRERRVEFAFEGLRYYDILRWGIAGTELNWQFTGMKLTNTPNTYNDFAVDAEGYLIYQKRAFKVGVNELWPIPLSEIQINPKLTQNKGY
ncbi:RagB/SusD family nutrient uptake outer membrane protein [Sphingobacterium griseoflavum]|uniref:Glycan metabolism protein RagB n=1 Tax=Sphingobacterium griseoflavum TaxID=1474952 RepID=A0ABQ3HXS4_9SPHI|nr:RagB/SusD family nutrient uptake outer membrane protein [Sphingobacterium griseoflavum]GHE45195.1 glycan metabolism protein RagB [Sphingobacterium griseoflavum]